MAIELKYKQEAIDTTNDSIVIVKYIHGINGGVALNPTATDNVAWKTQAGNTIVPAGIPVFYDSTNGFYLGSMHFEGANTCRISFATTDTSLMKFVGVVAATVDFMKSGVSVMTHGVINADAIKVNGVVVEHETPQLLTSPFASIQFKLNV